jgi:GNAT superfamily N-acetyltransferase
MKHTEYDDEVIEDAPVRASLKVLRQSEIAEDDEDAIDWSEVQRLLHERDWGPILRLPATEDDFFCGQQWEDGVDVSAFNTHDFWRQRGVSMRRYRAALDWAYREEECVMITLSMVRDRLPLPESDLVFGYLRRGVINESMVHDDIMAVLRLSGRLERIQQRIKRIKWARNRRLRQGACGE